MRSFLDGSQIPGLTSGPGFCSIMTDRSVITEIESMKTISLTHGNIAYLEQGQGRPLVLLHANPGDHQDFAAIMPVLAENFRVIAPDWPGYGQSPAPQPPQAASAFLYAAILQEFMVTLDLSGVILLGNSVGGFAAVRAALDMPERVAGLVLVSPGGFTPHTAVTRLFCWLQGSEWVIRRSVVWFAKQYLRRRTTVTAAMLQRAAAEQQTATAVAVNAAIWRSFTEPAHDLREAARHIQAPTLVVSGRHDPVIPAHKDGKIAAAAIPQARQIVLGTGHAPFAEDPEAFLTAVQPFWQLFGEMHEPTV